MCTALDWCSLANIGSECSWPLIEWASIRCMVHRSTAHALALHWALPGQGAVSPHSRMLKKCNSSHLEWWPMCHINHCRLIGCFHCCIGNLTSISFPVLNIFVRNFWNLTFLFYYIWNFPHYVLFYENIYLYIFQNLDRDISISKENCNWRHLFRFMMSRMSGHQCLSAIYGITPER